MLLPVEKKLSRRKEHFHHKNRSESQFWRSLLDLREDYQKGRVIEVNSGEMTIGSSMMCGLGVHPYQLVFIYGLFQIARDSDIRVAEAWRDGQWTVQFRRQLVGVLRDDRQQLLTMLNEVTLVEGRDKTIWALEQ